MIELVKDKLENIGDICRRHGVARLEVFGSATDGTFDPARSDIDFLVEFVPGYDLGPWMSEYFELKEDLKNLFGRKIDLLESGSVKNPFRKRAIEKTRKVVYAD